MFYYAQPEAIAGGPKEKGQVMQKFRAVWACAERVESTLTLNGKPDRTTSRDMASCIV